MTSTNWNIGKILGIPVFLDLTFFIAFSFFSASLSGLFTGSPAVKVFFGMVATAVLFGSVLLHELGHCLAARLVGEEPTRITLFFMGGLASLKGLGKSPSAAFLIAVCGPLVSALLGVALFFLKGGGVGNWGEVLSYGSYLNLALCLLNLVPIVPLDGGRIVVACLWGGFAAKSIQGMEGYYRASESAVKWIGRPLLFLTVMLLLWKSQLTLWLVLIGLFLLFVMQSEQRLAKAMLHLVPWQAKDIMVSVGEIQDITNQSDIPQGVSYVKVANGPEQTILAVQRSSEGEFEKFVPELVLGVVPPDKSLLELASIVVFESVRGVWLVAEGDRLLGVVPSNFKKYA